MLGAHFKKLITFMGSSGSGRRRGSEAKRDDRREGMWGKGCGVSRATREGRSRGMKRKEKKWRPTRGDGDNRGGSEDEGGAFRGGNRTGELLTWTSSEKPVCTEPSKMELRVVPTYSVSPRPSAIVRTGPKSSGT